MPNKFIHKTYNQWIELNHSRFKYAPYIIKSKSKYFILGFTGLTKCLTCSVQKCGQFGLFIYDEKGTYWDIVWDFDIYERHTDDGKYYCELCIEKTYYLTKTDFWIAHSFEPLLDWINSLTPDTYVCLYGNPKRGFWGARLLTDPKLYSGYPNRFSVVA